MDTDYSRFLNPNDVTSDALLAGAYLAIFEQNGELASIGPGKRQLQDVTARQLYGAEISAELRTKIDADIAKARQGERITCKGIGRALFPDRFPAPDAQLSSDLA